MCVFAQYASSATPEIPTAAYDESRQWCATVLAALRNMSATMVSAPETISRT